MQKIGTQPIQRWIFF